MPVQTPVLRELCTFHLLLVKARNIKDAPAAADRALTRALSTPCALDNRFWRRWVSLAFFAAKAQHFFSLHEFGSVNQVGWHREQIS